MRPAGEKAGERPNKTLEGAGLRERDSQDIETHRLPLSECLGGTGPMPG